jgi:poly-gamma-glutamate capsule biosynthesis protein CapA/YwtB (metallophosphatase superfamily)
VTGGLLTLFLGGDVMTGRGVDQILPHPGDPELQEGYVRDARAYVRLAEEVNGPIPRPADFAWPWGDALRTLHDAAPDARVVNLETSITTSGDFAAGKAVHYRMHPDNVPCLTAARPDVCALANNHVLDFGDRGLLETLAVLARAGLRAAGAGRDAAEARRAAVVPAGGGRVVVFAVGTGSSGVPRGWAAGEGPGVDYLTDLSAATAAEIADRVRRGKRPGDVVVVSIHWGSNWGYEVAEDRVRFAHELVGGGVDVVHGHSSHHPRPVEVHQDKLILYGCGDLIDDYEGIAGRDEYRDDLRLLYFASLEQGTGRLVRLWMAPMQARRMRLHRASDADAAWLGSVLDRISRPFGSRVDLGPDGMLTLRHSV